MRHNRRYYHNNHNSGNRASLAAKRRRALAEAIAEGKKRKGELELIIKAVEPKREEVAQQLQRIGTVRHFYNHIPYLSLVCDADYADILRKASSGSVSDSVFEESFRSIISAITTIDLSNNFTIPKLSTSAAVISKPKTRAGLWNLEAIGAYKAQQYGSGEGVNVAVIDTGIDYNHCQLQRRFEGKKGYDFVRNNEEPMDGNGHGTHVAGIIAAADYGIATSCRLYAVRVLDENGSGTEADAIAGIEWCIKNNVDAANMSFGGPVASQALEEVCRYAWQHGTLLVAAAGNNGYGPNYPAAFGEPVIAVAAVDESLGHPEFSSIWKTNDISAPGVNIVSTYPGESYARMSGTSMSAPHVTSSLAVAASIAAAGDLERIMKETADNDDYNEPEVFGAGLIRVDNMARYLAGTTNVGRARQTQLLPILKDYFELEKAADLAVSKFAKEAVAEVRRLLS